MHVVPNAIRGMGWIGFDISGWGEVFIWNFSS